MVADGLGRSNSVSVYYQSLVLQMLSKTSIASDLFQELADHSGKSLNPNYSCFQHK